MTLDFVLVSFQRVFQELRPAIPSVQTKGISLKDHECLKKKKLIIT